jgi:hypothetical protein
VFVGCASEQACQWVGLWQQQQEGGGDGICLMQSRVIPSSTDTAVLSKCMGEAQIDCLNWIQTHFLDRKSGRRIKDTSAGWVTLTAGAK